jgi:tetratricopeptide (TPR) repeat protein
VELANSWGWIAKAHEAQGRFDAAVQAQHAKIDVLRKMSSADKDREAQRHIANAGYELGRLELAQGRLDAAVQSTQAALEQYEALVAADRANTVWLAQMSFVRASLAETQIALGARAAARSSIDRATADVLRLLATDATRSSWNITLRGKLMLHRLALEEPQVAQRTELEAFLAGVARAEAVGKPLDAEQRLVVAAAELRLGDLCSRAQQVAAAHGHWQAAAARSQVSAQSNALPAMTLLAQARLRLGQTDAARALARQIEASPYRHPAYADLRNRLAAAAGAAAVP